MIIHAADFSDGFTFRSEARVKGERERERERSWSLGRARNASRTQQLSASGFDEEISREQSKVRFRGISSGIHDEFRESDETAVG